MKQKKVPSRLCLGCRQSKPKKELLRIVRVAQKLLDEEKVEETICVDLTGKLAGRGAYICRDVMCLNNAIKAKRFEKEFEMPMREEIFERIKIEMEKIDDK